MFIRLKRTATSFVVMVGVFWVYRLIAEPLIEPPAVEKRVQPVSPEERAAAQRQRQNRLGVYARFFPEGAWERDNPIVLESDNSKLLLKEYTNTPDGRVELHPCTVIYLPDGESDGADHRRVIIMQAPQGAVLRFDEAVDLSRGKMGRLLGGVLNGPVTIQSGPTKPEGGDDLLITTHDVVMDDNVISTPNPVDFRFGASVGHGRELENRAHSFDRAKRQTPRSQHRRRANDSTAARCGNAFANWRRGLSARRSAAKLFAANGRSEWKGSGRKSKQSAGRHSLSGAV